MQRGRTKRCQVPIRARRRQSDAKWRASVASCYETLKFVIPNGKVLPKRKASKVIVFQYTDWFPFLFACVFWVGVGEWVTRTHYRIRLKHRNLQSSHFTLLCLLVQLCKCTDAHFGIYSQHNGGGGGGILLHLEKHSVQW